MTIKKWQELITARSTAWVSLVACLAWLVSPLQSLAVPWTPVEITVTAWYDASDASTIHDTGGLVDQWDDKSTNANNAAASGADRPTTGYDINGTNAIYFNVDVMDSGLTQLSNSVSIYFVAQAISKGGNGNNCVIESTPTVIAGGLYTTLSAYTGGAASYGVLYTTAISGANRFLNGVAAATDHGFNPAIFSHSGSGLSSLGRTYNIGSSVSDGVSSTKAYIGEIVICPTVHDTKTRQRMEGYLAWKWGLEADLPAGHPYKSAKPVTGVGTVIVIR